MRRADLFLLALLVPFPAPAGAAPQTRRELPPGWRARTLGIGEPAPLPDGETVAVPCTDGTVRLFELETGLTRRVLAAHEADTLAVVPSPDGRLLATSSEDRTVRLWDTATGACRATLDPGARVNPSWGDTLRFAPDGSMLAAVEARGRCAIVWDVETGAPILELPDEIRARAAAWSSDSRTLATVGADRCARLWRMAPRERIGEELAELRHPEPLRTVAFHPDRLRLATGSEGITAYLWDSARGALLARAELGEPIADVQSIQQLLFTSDGEALVATTGGFWNVFLCDPATLRQRWRIDFEGGASAPMTVALDRAGARIALSSEPLIVSRDGAVLHRLAKETWYLRFTPQDRYVVAVRCVGEEPLEPGYACTVVLAGDTLEPLYERTEYSDGTARIRTAR